MAKIVICEDDPTTMRAILASLQGCGHELYPARDGWEGWTLVQREQHALVITDIVMPVFSGLELVDAIRADADLQYVRVVVLSAAAQRGDLAEGYRHGADDYITKPFVVTDLRDRVPLMVEGDDLAPDAA